MTIQKEDIFIFLNVCVKNKMTDNIKYLYSFSNNYIEKWQ